MAGRGFIFKAALMISVYSGLSATFKRDFSGSPAKISASQSNYNENLKKTDLPLHFLLYQNGQLKSIFKRLGFSGETWQVVPRKS